MTTHNSTMYDVRTVKSALFFLNMMFFSALILISGVMFYHDLVIYNGRSPAEEPISHVLMFSTVWTGVAIAIACALGSAVASHKKRRARTT